MYKNIMVAIDDSDTARHALDEAIKLCKALKAKLHIFHIMDESVLNIVDEYLDFDTLWNAYKEAGQALLDKAKAVVENAGVSYEMHIVELKPYTTRLAEKIVAEAQALPADILIIGTHGRRGFSRVFLGSVAENVSRIAPLPVLLVSNKSAP